MKPILFLMALWTMLTYGSPSAHSLSNDEGIRREKKLEKQLQSYLSYPNVLQKSQRGGIVMIRFQVDTGHRITNLEVLTDNPALKATIEQELAGKNILGNVAEPTQIYLARLRFKPGA
ncbi:hypothetical protein DYU11_16580 [Fibrisoma montanum]|uniref:TonB C-terminal domain-containing protein n=1 Tax=Fibrisoma montanum TaxID=2305895 RepID=A0A418M950_9BACT|nr:hypothetical protein [Fibrisoma montanum]RIV22624.1 hypothetical protein DYU11_16580 [Fibrisoma montanum]